MIAWAAMLPSKAGAWDGVEALQAMLKGTDKPIVGFGRMSYQMTPEAVEAQEAAGFPFLQGLEPTLRALNALWFYAQRARQDAAGAAPRPAERSLAGHSRRDARALRHRAAEEQRRSRPPPKPRQQPRRSAFRSRSRSVRPTSCTRPRPAASCSICAAARRCDSRRRARSRRHAQRIRTRASTASWCRKWCRASRRSSARATMRSTGRCCWSAPAACWSSSPRTRRCGCCRSTPGDVTAMIDGLKLNTLLAGFRGRPRRRPRRAREDRARAGAVLSRSPRAHRRHRDQSADGARTNGAVAVDVRVIWRELTQVSMGDA